MGVHNWIMKTHSKVIGGQIEKECMARDATLERYLATVRRMENYFKGFTVEYIKRAKKQRSFHKNIVTAIHSLKSIVTARCVLCGHRRSFHKNSRARAHNGKHYRGGRLVSTDHAIPLPSL
jgi:hypothetical protein